MKIPRVKEWKDMLWSEKPYDLMPTSIEQLCDWKEKLSPVVVSKLPFENPSSAKAKLSILALLPAHLRRKELRLLSLPILTKK